jgi:hypothetical protein
MSFTTEEKEYLATCRSQKQGTQCDSCMICNTAKNADDLSTLVYRLSPYSWIDSNYLQFCKQCEEKAKYVYLNELLTAKILPTQKCLFDPTINLVIKRTHGFESEGHLQDNMGLGWSASNNEITTWVFLPNNGGCSKPLILSLLFEANPDLLNMSEFKDGLRIEFQFDDIFKREFPEFYAKVQASTAQINERFFPTAAKLI